MDITLLLQYLHQLRASIYYVLYDTILWNFLDRIIFIRVSVAIAIDLQLPPRVAPGAGDRFLIPPCLDAVTLAVHLQSS